MVQQRCLAGSAGMGTVQVEALTKLQYLKKPGDTLLAFCITADFPADSFVLFKTKLPTCTVQAAKGSDSMYLILVAKNPS